MKVLHEDLCEGCDTVLTYEEQDSEFDDLTGAPAETKVFGFFVCDDCAAAASDEDRWQLEDEARARTGILATLEMRSSGLV